MNDRQKKARREARREASKPIVTRTVKTTPAPSNIGADKFRVARVKKELAPILPQGIRQRTGEHLQAGSLRHLDPKQMQQQQVQTHVSPAIAQSPARTRPSVSLDERVADPGKCRPKDNTPKGGAGSSRSFHLWKKTC